MTFSIGVLKDFLPKINPSLPETEASTLPTSIAVPSALSESLMTFCGPAPVLLYLLGSSYAGGDDTPSFLEESIGTFCRPLSSFGVPGDGAGVAVLSSSVGRVASCTFGTGILPY